MSHAVCDRVLGPWLFSVQLLPFSASTQYCWWADYLTLSRRFCMMEASCSCIFDEARILGLSFKAPANAFLNGFEAYVAVAAPSARPELLSCLVSLFVKTSLPLSLLVVASKFCICWSRILLSSEASPYSLLLGGSILWFHGLVAAASSPFR